jgi:hypothetical protein
LTGPIGETPEEVVPDSGDIPATTAACEDIQNGRPHGAPLSVAAVGTRPRALAVIDDSTGIAMAGDLYPDDLLLGCFGKPSGGENWTPVAF